MLSFEVFIGGFDQEGGRLISSRSACTGMVRLSNCRTFEMLKC